MRHKNGKYFQKCPTFASTSKWQTHSKKYNQSCQNPIRLTRKMYTAVVYKLKSVLASKFKKND